MIKLGFRDKEGQIEYIRIIPDNSPIANIWLSQLDHLLTTHREKIFQKNFSLLGFDNKYRTADNMCDDLERSIKIINDNTDNKIVENYDILRYTYDQQLLNQLHHHFEIRQGQLWAPSQELFSANGETRAAICYLNHCCHELEAWYDTQLKIPSKPSNGYFYYNLLGVTDRIEIDNKFKKNFVKDITDGLVYLHYAQTGKTWFEAYLDNDDIVDISNISEHRIISGEFNCYFGPGFQIPVDNKFIDWLKSKGIDSSDENLGIGYIPVGKIENLPYHSAVDFFRRYTDFYSIELYNNKVEYNYRYYDKEYLDNLNSMWNKWVGD
jgi:hypothetical protein